MATKDTLICIYLSIKDIIYMINTKEKVNVLVNKLSECINKSMYVSIINIIFIRVLLYTTDLVVKSGLYEN